jgi:hypothetical protein
MGEQDRHGAWKRWIVAQRAWEGLSRASYGSPRSRWRNALVYEAALTT